MTAFPDFILRSFLCCLLAGSLPAFGAAPPAPALVKGTIQAVMEESIAVNTPEGRIDVRLTANTRILLNLPASLSDIKPGMFVGSAATPGQDGRLRAVEVHFFPESMRGFGEGHRGWFADDVTMTNGSIVRVEGTSTSGNQTDISSTLLIDHANGSREVLVTADIPVTRVEGASIKDLSIGMKVSCLVRTSENGLVAVMVSGNGHF